MLPFYPQSGKHLLQQIPQIRVDRYIYTSYNNCEDQKTYMVFRGADACVGSLFFVFSYMKEYALSRNLYYGIRFFRYKISQWLLSSSTASDLLQIQGYPLRFLLYATHEGNHTHPALQFLHSPQIPEVSSLRFPQGLTLYLPVSIYMQPSLSAGSFHSISGMPSP